MYCWSSTEETQSFLLTGVLTITKDVASAIPNNRLLPGKIILIAWDRGICLATSNLNVEAIELHMLNIMLFICLVEKTI